MKNSHGIVTKRLIRISKSPSKFSDNVTEYDGFLGRPYFNKKRKQTTDKLNLHRTIIFIFYNNEKIFLSKETIFFAKMFS